MAEVVQWFRIDSESSAPLFDQLRTAVIAAVRDGRLAAGTRLPTVRELAGELGLAVNTVARAYRELAKQGILSVRQGRGASVVSARQHCGAAEQENLRKKVSTLVNEALLLGLRSRDVHTMIDSELRRLKEASK